MLEDIVSQYKGGFAPGASTELRAQRNLTRRLALISGSLTTNQRTSVGGIGARVYKDGVYGFASAAELTGEAAGKVLESATANAELLARYAGRTTGARSPSFSAGSVSVAGIVCPSASIRISSAVKAASSAPETAQRPSSIAAVSSRDISLFMVNLPPFLISAL